MDIFKEFATDKDKETRGVWHDVPGGEARLLVARQGNSEYSKAAVKAFSGRHNRRLRDDDEKTKDIVRGLVAEHILLDWEGVEFKGKPLEYSVENAKMLLKVEDFFNYVWELAGDIDAYRAEVEEEVGNS